MSIESELVIKGCVVWRYTTVLISSDGLHYQPCVLSGTHIEPPLCHCITQYTRLLSLYHVTIGNFTLRVQQTAMFIYKGKQQQGECKYGRVK